MQWALASKCSNTRVSGITKQVPGLIGSGGAEIVQSQVEVRLRFVQLAGDVSVVNVDGDGFAGDAYQEVAELGGQVPQGEYRQHVPLVQPTQLR